MLQGAITAEREPHNDVEQISPLDQIERRSDTYKTMCEMKDETEGFLLIYFSVVLLFNN